MEETSTPVTPASQPEEKPRFGAIQRIFGVLFNPNETFADIARVPSWLAPVILGTVLSIGFCYVMSQRVDWHDYFRTQGEKNARFAQLSEEQKEQSLGIQVKVAGAMVWVMGALGTFIGAVFVGWFYMLAFNTLAGSGIQFKQAFGLAAHCFMTSIVSAPLAMITMWFRNRGDVTPENMLASNLGVMLESDAKAWMKSLLGSLDIFTIWFLILVALAFSAANKKKAPTGKALAIVFTIWVVWIIIKMGWAAAFS